MGKTTIMLKVLLIIAVVGTLNACVTTETGGIGTKADEKKALDFSVRLARDYIRQGNWDSAKRHLKKALEMDSSNPEIYEALALVFQNTGEIELAEKNYKKSIRLNEKFSRVRNNYAAFLYQQKRYSEAVGQLQVVAEDTLYTKRASAYVNLGRAYLQLGELSNAEQAFKRAHLMDKRNIGLLYELADVYYQLQDYPQSQQFYNAYRSRARQQPSQALWLGIRLAEKFNNQNALSSYALALKNLYPASKEYLLYQQQFGTQ